MADIPRPHTVMGYHTPLEYVDTNTKIAENFVATPGFRQTLSNYYPKASAADKARCLELLTSLDIGDAIKEGAKDLPPRPGPYEPVSYVQKNTKMRRPKSAMEFTSSDRVGPRPDIFNPYTTSYSTAYTVKASSPTPTVRPKSTGAKQYQASHDLSGPIGGTEYRSAYYDSPGATRENSKTEVTRVGTSSGNRRNNPQPAQEFIVWKFPRKVTRDVSAGCLGQPLTDDLMDKVMRGQLTTTYQSDYMGYPAGYPLEELIQITDPDWKTKVPYTLDSMSRRTYNKPWQQDILKTATTRYGSHTNRATAKGIAPVVPVRHMYNLNSRTTYDREYNDATAPLPTQVRDLGREYGTQSIRKYMPRAECTTDKRSMEDMLKAMNLAVPETPSVSHVQRIRPRSAVGSYSRPLSRGSCRTNSSGYKCHYQADIPTSQVESPLIDCCPVRAGCISQAAY